MGFHPNIQKLLRYEEICEIPCMIFEYVEPYASDLVTLEDHLCFNPPDTMQILDWGIEICSAMEHAHEYSLVCHPNLEPRNILIAEDMTSRITGFDYAAFRGEMVDLPGERMMDISYTPNKGFFPDSYLYMPPERLKNPSSACPSSDIYSFGVILYQMINAGNMLFRGRIKQETLESPDQLSRELRAMDLIRRARRLPWMESPFAPIIYQCLDEDVAKRPGFNEIKEHFQRMRMHLEWDRAGINSEHKR